jgi:hypothetical protein
MAILPLGLTSAPARASEPGKVCIERETAEHCRRSIEKFNELAIEAGLIRRQRDETTGALFECRRIYGDERAIAMQWQARAENAERALDGAPSRLVWFGYGATAGATAVILALVLSR